MTYNLSQHFIGRPLMVEEDRLNHILNALDVRADGFGMDPEDDQEDPEDKPEPICVIEVKGTLVGSGPSWLSYFGYCLYDEIRGEMEEAFAEGKAIVLNINSGGGEASGCFELADFIVDLRKKGAKVYCSVEGYACSAAYALAAACERVYMTRASKVGSIGVYAVHCDQSKFDASIGLKYTICYAGEYKAELNPHKPASAGAIERLQALVDFDYGLFIQSVSKNRDLNESAVVGTKAAILTASDALPNFADRIGTLQDVIADIKAELQIADQQQPAAAEEPSVVAAVAARKMGDLESYKEFSLTPCMPVALASHTPEVAGPARIVKGCVAPYNSPSELLGAGYREMYAPGCFSQSIANNDIRALMHHDDAKVVGCLSAGTLRLDDRADGLYYEIDMPDTTYGRDGIESLQRRDITGSSTRYWVSPTGYYFTTVNGERVRVVTSAELVEVSLVTWPAYLQTSAAIAAVEPQAAMASADIEDFELRARLLAIQGATL